MIFIRANKLLLHNPLIVQQISNCKQDNNIHILFQKSEYQWLNGLRYPKKGTSTSQAKNFSQARGMNRRFLSVFSREREQESMLGPTTGTGNEKRRTLRESNDHAKATAVRFSIGETTSKQKMHHCLHEV